MSTSNITIVKLFNENNDNERYFTVLTLEPMSMTEMLDILFGDIEDERLHVTPVSKDISQQLKFPQGDFCFIFLIITWHSSPVLLLYTHSQGIQPLSKLTLI